MATPRPEPDPGLRPSINGWRRLLLDTHPWTDHEVQCLLRSIDDPIRLRAFCATGRPPVAAVQETTNPVVLSGLLFDAITLRKQAFGDGTLVTADQARNFLMQAVTVALRTEPLTPRQLRDLAPMLAMVAPEAFTLEADCARTVLAAAQQACSNGWARFSRPVGLDRERFEIMPAGRIEFDTLLTGAWKGALAYTASDRGTP